MKQLVYTMFITYNHASFHLWWEEDLLKYQKSQNIIVNHFYDQLCLKNTDIP